MSVSGEQVCFTYQKSSRKKEIKGSAGRSSAANQGRSIPRWGQLRARPQCYYSSRHYLLKQIIVFKGKQADEFLKTPTHTLSLLRRRSLPTATVLHVTNKCTSLDRGVGKLPRSTRIAVQNWHCAGWVSHDV